MDSTKDVVMDVLGWVGTTLALFFFISPATLIWNLLKGKTPISAIPWMIMIANVINCEFWVAYAIPQGDDKTIIWICNSIGASFNLLYISLFFIALVKKDILKSIGAVLLTLAVTGAVFFVFYMYVDFEINGKIAMAFNIVMWAAPSQKMVLIC